MNLSYFLDSIVQCCITDDVLSHKFLILLTIMETEKMKN